MWTAINFASESVQSNFHANCFGELIVLFTLWLYTVTGVCAAVVDIGATWMSDLKEGVCIDAFWLNREHCCWASNDTSFDSERCPQVCLCHATLLLL